MLNNNIAVHLSGNLNTGVQMTGKFAKFFFYLTPVVLLTFYSLRNPLGQIWTNGIFTVDGLMYLNILIKNVINRFDFCNPQQSQIPLAFLPRIYYIYCQARLI